MMGSTTMRKGSGREKIFDIDDTSPTPAQVKGKKGQLWLLMLWFFFFNEAVLTMCVCVCCTSQNVENFRYRQDAVDDPISAVTASDKSLIVGRESGMAQQYLLPHIRYMHGVRSPLTFLGSNRAFLQV